MHTLIFFIIASICSGHISASASDKYSASAAEPVASLSVSTAANTSLARRAVNFRTPLSAAGKPPRPIKEEDIAFDVSDSGEDGADPFLGIAFPRPPRLDEIRSTSASTVTVMSPSSLASPTGYTPSACTIARAVSVVAARAGASSALIDTDTTPEEIAKMQAHKVRGRRKGTYPLGFIEDFVDKTVPQILDGKYSDGMAYFAANCMRRALYTGPEVNIPGTVDHDAMVALVASPKYNSILTKKLRPQLDAYCKKYDALCATQEGPSEDEDIAFSYVGYISQNFAEPTRGIHAWDPETAAPLIAKRLLADKESWFAEAIREHDAFHAGHIKISGAVSAVGSHSAASGATASRLQ